MNKTIFSVLVLSLIFLSAIFFPKGIYAQGKPGNDLVPDNYIVVFKDNISNPNEHASDMAKRYGLSVAFSYSHALKGFSATIPAARLEQIRNDSSVKFISQDRFVSIDAKSQGKPSPQPTQPPQVLPSGVKRIGQNTSNFGAGVGVAVIDTGIDLAHPDLSGNILGNYSCVKGKSNGDDDNGHGTHVAGTIAALDNGIGVVGVAPRASLYAIKVLNAQGSGTWSSVICGIDWVTAHASTVQVANMSLGGGGSSDDNCGLDNHDALHQAICRSRNASVTYVVAAGNETDDTANHVPAAYDDAVITVSALVDSDGLSGGGGSSTTYGADDTFASFSNFGSAVDLGAPGVSIRSTWKGASYNTISGTSMATPHVSGAAALYIGIHSNASWTEVREGLKGLGEPAGSGHTGTEVHPERVVLTGSI